MFIWFGRGRLNGLWVKKQNSCGLVVLIADGSEPAHCIWYRILRFNLQIFFTNMPFHLG